MAINPCKECGGPVSDKAEAAHNVEQNKKRKLQSWH